MVQTSSDNRPVEPESEEALDKLKFEVAEDLGLDDDIKKRGWANMTTREVGKIGGNMVRRLVQKAEKDLSHHEP
ncbi:alpha/beta-type small acid-soluble spore protein [Sulfobacillus thermosulfidooxidans]|uniref:Small, acid-soluble spore protein, alpha/beta type n=2 Tax=Sulfobacillus thermosulfidooxidans TaxID=28034 RepID=A0A1W1WKL2_SULTA|nr:alpha/beta-type small acid-soluble spore protein [Sulfobacillus thermosulfidooxidans]OLZ12242.1 spore protein alpha/beta [Sulfobacillus thermosulfidooxidans]OLZ12977.1 spore protein alpha/beta [Sulfobacillus thermosulfidooxidans]OLZ21778.1 spore protein alpha/beta [Sulfobacillus thermosulfidooxidans]PSR27644.1 MAG: small acid-soluble spore protein [Sulfobacillus thermosulfidooxidans]SMC06540.1 Small, acid-soluble spore protein, alpha/beta type [Sulfobacillus thermosulfidooxidans DSM 9293]